VFSFSFPTQKGQCFFCSFSLLLQRKEPKERSPFSRGFWALPKNQNRFAKFSTEIQKFFTQSNSKTDEKGVGVLRYSL